MTNAEKSKHNQKYRLITRSDMDGLVCAVILKKLDLVDDILFAHPRDMQHGEIKVSNRDITTNLPYVEGVHMCFDHHASEAARINEQPDNHIIDANAPSAARVLYNYYEGDKNPALSDLSKEILEAVDKADSAQFDKDDILNPEGWELMSFIMDARTGLGRFRDFNISNYELMMDLIQYCHDNLSIEEILETTDVKERILLYREQEEKFKEQIQRCAKVHGDLVVLDLRNEDTIWAGNRFMIYALFPQCNISMHVLWGKNKQNTVFAVGKSIFDRSNSKNIGEIMLKYGGGGHNAAGTCQIENLKAKETLTELIDIFS